MSEEEKKVVENFKSFIEQKEKEQETLYENEEFYKDDIEQNELFLKMLHSILNLIEKQSKEIEHLKNLNEHQSKDMTKAVNYTFEQNKELEIKDKMIDEMAKEINKAHFEQNDFEKWFEKMLGVQKKMDYGYVVDVIKYHFRKKVENNERR